MSQLSLTPTISVAFHHSDYKCCIPLQLSCYSTRHSLLFTCNAFDFLVLQSSSLHTSLYHEDYHLIYVVWNLLKYVLIICHIFLSMWPANGTFICYFFLSTWSGICFQIFNVWILTVLYLLQDLRGLNNSFGHRSSCSSSTGDTDRQVQFVEPAYSFVGMHCIFDNCKASGDFYLHEKSSFCLTSFLHSTFIEFIQNENELINYHYQLQF